MRIKGNKDFYKMLHSLERKRKTEYGETVMTIEHVPEDDKTLQHVRVYLNGGKKLRKRDFYAIEDVDYGLLKEIISAKGLYCRDISKKIGLSVPAISNRMAGRAKFDKIEVERLCKVLDIDLEEVVRK